MPTSISTIVCNQDKDVLCVLTDGMMLFPSGTATRLEHLFDGESIIKLNLLFEKAGFNRSALNWKLVLASPDLMPDVYCSVLSWLGNIFVRFSDQPISSFFFDLIVDNDKPAALFFPFQSNIENDELPKGYSQLYSELTYIQRELQRKNVQIEQLNERLEILANIDPLTGLYNRRAILNRAKLELIRAVREKKLLGLAIIDIDQLQTINDQYGHPTGDLCLKETALVLQNSIRQYDTVGRIDADEFLIVFSINSVSQLDAILKRLLQNINDVKLAAPSAEVIPIKASIGGLWLTAVNPDDQIEDLVNQAELNLIASKSRGGNQITITEHRLNP